MDLQAAFDHGFEAVKSYVDAEFAARDARLAEIEARPVEKGERGADGSPGPEGPSGPKGDSGELAILPPELAGQVAIAVRMLHESPPLEQRSQVPQPLSRVTRIERDDDGNFVPVYEMQS